MTRQISFDEVKKHNNKDSVWIVIHNDVYDVTSYLEEHPGGEEALLDVAGKDGTQAFEDVGHSEDARTVMKKFKIGTLPPSEQSGSSNVTNCSHKTPVCKSCSATSYPRLPKNESTEKTWRTYDGSTGSSHASLPKSQYKEPESLKTERRLQSIVVPRERGQGQRRSSSSSPGSNLKWAIVALAGAIVVGIVIKKYLS